MREIRGEIQKTELNIEPKLIQTEADSRRSPVKFIAFPNAKFETSYAVSLSYKISDRSGASKGLSLMSTKSELSANIEARRYGQLVIISDISKVSSNFKELRSLKFSDDDITNLLFWR